MAVFVLTTHKYNIHKYNNFWLHQLLPVVSQRGHSVGGAIRVNTQRWNAMMKIIETDYDMFGKKIEWKKCVECGGLVWTTEKDESKVLCGSDYCLTNKHYEPVSKYSKEPIPDSIRWAVWERDNFTCQHCGSRKNLTVDHIHPETKGGELTLENTQTLCKRCNSKKGAR